MLLVDSARIYGVLLVLYPKTFRSCYAAEMRRDFLELMLEGLQEEGATKLVRVCEDGNVAVRSFQDSS